jgi:predicted SPOUT superfamily RNA methylase MTH1
MLETPRRRQRLSVALPASFTKDIPHLREKTSRAGIIARALAIFRTDEAIIYQDELKTASQNEGKLLEKLLSYQETPQYIRRTIFAKDPDLQFAGILPPLRLPSHPSAEKPRIGLVRDAVVVREGNHSAVDAGLDRLVNVGLQLKRQERVTVRLTRTTPRLEGELVEPSRLPIYWGFRVTRKDFTLGRLIREERVDLLISTSRKGRLVRDVLQDLGSKWKSSHRTLILFGSPDEGVPEMLSREGIEVEKACNFNLNMIPDQGVATVRTEEALIATLSTLNLLEEK